MRNCHSPQWDSAFACTLYVQSSTERTAAPVSASGLGPSAHACAADVPVSAAEQAARDAHPRSELYCSSSLSLSLSLFLSLYFSLTDSHTHTHTQVFANSHRDRNDVTRIPDYYSCPYKSFSLFLSLSLFTSTPTPTPPRPLSRSSSFSSSAAVLLRGKHTQAQRP